jgi:hypothetical protein
VSNATNVQAGSPAYTAAQAAQWGSNFTVTWRPQMSDDAEQQAKMDFTVDVQEKLPFLTSFKTGFQRRDRSGNGWGGGGLHGASRHRQRGRRAATSRRSWCRRKTSPSTTALHADGDLHATLPIRLCRGTTVGTNNSPVANLNNALFGTMTFTPTELDTLISSALYTKDYPFLGDYPDKGMS